MPQVEIEQPGGALRNSNSGSETPALPTSLWTRGSQWLRSSMAFDNKVRNQKEVTVDLATLSSAIPLCFVLPMWKQLMELRLRDLACVLRRVCLE